MRSEHVIALDPGGRSGWASARMSLDRLELTGTGVLRQDRMAQWLAQHQDVRWVRPGHITAGQTKQTTAKRRFDVVVYESWHPRRINGSMDWIEGDPLLSAQHVGQIRLIASMSGAELVEQHPSDKPTAVASMPDWLKALDEDSNELHDQDARMHLWLYFFRNWFSAKVGVEDVQA